MEIAEYHSLIEHGILGRVELVAGKLTISGGVWELALSPTQVRAARAIGIERRSCVDLVLEDDLALAELLARLRQS